MAQADSANTESTETNEGASIGSGVEYDTGRQDAVSSGAKIRAKIKRGEGTRDQDELVIEGRGSNAEEAAEDFEAALTMAEQGEWADRLRALEADE